jgi:hypothetical protein
VGGELSGGEAVAGGETVAGTETALVDVVVEPRGAVGFVTFGVVMVIEPRGAVGLVVILVGGSKPWTPVEPVEVVGAPTDAVDAQPATMAMAMTAAPAATHDRWYRGRVRGMSVAAPLDTEPRRLT